MQYPWNERNSEPLRFDRARSAGKWAAKKLFDGGVSIASPLEQNRFYELTRYVGAIFAVSFDRQAL